MDKSIKHSTTKKLISLLVTFIFLIIFSCSDKAQEDAKQQNSYNYRRGIEAFENKEQEEALKYFNQELKENPKNGYAFLWIAIIRQQNEEFGRALTAITQSIKLIPKKNAEYRSYAFQLRGDIYEGLKEMDKALESYSEAIKLYPTDTYSYKKRAELYYNLDEYELSDQDYRKIIEIDPENVIGYMGLGRNAQSQEKYEEAIKQFDHVIKLDADYSLAYSFRAESYAFLKKYNNSVDDIIKALDIDHDDKAFYLLQEVVDSASNIVTSKLKVQSLKDPNNYYWYYCLGMIHEQIGNYREAISLYKKDLEMDMNDVTCCRIAACFKEMGNYEPAINYINQAIQLDTTYYKYILIKADIENDAGYLSDAIVTMNSYISKQPDNPFGYNWRGWFKNKNGDYDGAMEDYTTCITLDPDYSHDAYLWRGIIKKRQNDKKAAEADFRKSIELDSIPDDVSSAHFAYFYLGEIDKAKEWMDKILAEYPDKSCYYDAACLYSLMNEEEKSIGYLKEAFEKGFRRFYLIEHDKDLDNIRQSEAFKTLLFEYKEKHKKEIQEDSLTSL